MNARFKKSVAIGTIKAPPSKSYAHRYLISGALSGNSKIFNVDFSNDIKATLSCLKSLGFIYKINNDDVYFDGYRKNNDVCNCLESGSTLRFLIPLSLVLNNEGRFIGGEKLFSRGLDVYLDIFKKQNIVYSLTKDSLDITGELKAGIYELHINKSSQYITGLLFALPLLKEDSEIHLLGKIESENYIDITIDTLTKFGVEINKMDNIIHIKGNQTYFSKNLEVEGDYSNSSFLEALNYINDGKVAIEGLNKNSLQGDKVYQEYFKKLVNYKLTISLSNCIDLGPVLFTFASMFEGARFVDISRLRIKESDRVIEMLDILTKFGVNYELKDNEVEIFKSKLHKVDEKISLPNDHRIVMATSLLLVKYGGEMENIEAVNKSFPNYFEALKKLGVEVEIYER